MKFVKTIVVTCILLLFFSCERAVDITKTRFYEKNNISFTYPKVWKVANDEEKNGYRNIFVESPGNSIFIIQVLDKSNALTLEEYSKLFSTNAIEATPVANRSKGNFTEFEINVNNNVLKGIQEDFSVSLLNQNIPHISKYYRLDTDEKVVYLISQTSIEDLKKVEPGFDLIIKSLSLYNT